ncbi:hypothetical protein [Lysobacter sp. yr284]|uniref:hypothetical protein n=1 Tax=Lysobacter sp. yr284 TaxID=1761791 RepID=UPI0011144A92|nr:hypothetical protein [Lysobacter sp. yr284]
MNATPIGPDAQDVLPEAAGAAGGELGLRDQRRQQGGQAEGGDHGGVRSQTGARAARGEDEGHADFRFERRTDNAVRPGRAQEQVRRPVPCLGVPRVCQSGCQHHLKYAVQGRAPAVPT